MSSVVVIADRLIDGTGRPPLRDAYLVSRDGVIREVGAGRPPALPPDAEVLRFPGATLLPGLVDGHLHLALAMHRPDWADIRDDPTRLALLAADGARRTLAAGVTTVGDCGAPRGVIIPVREAIAQGMLPGSRIWACGTWLTVTNGHGYFGDRWGLDSAEELRRGVRLMVHEGADFIKIMASGGTTGGGRTNRRRAQYSAEELRFAVDDAHRLGKRVHCHANATEAIAHCVQAGVDVIEHCNWLGTEPYTVCYDDAIAREAGRRGMWAGINLDAAFDPLTQRDGEAQDWGAATRWDLMRRMQDAGVRIYVNTDVLGRGFDSLPRMLARMVEEGRATAMEMIEMATLAPATAMGLQERIGSLEVGKLADVLVVPGDPLEDMQALTRPLAALKEGAVVAQGNMVRPRPTL